MKRFKLVLLVAAFALPASITLGVDEAVAEDDMVSREEVQSMIDEAVRKAFSQAVHRKRLMAIMKGRDERLEERFAERDEILEERQSEIYDRLVPAINDVTSDLKEWKEGFEEQKDAAPEDTDVWKTRVEQLSIEIEWIKNRCHNHKPEWSVEYGCHSDEWSTYR